MFSLFFKNWDRLDFGFLLVAFFMLLLFGCWIERNFEASLMDELALKNCSESTPLEEYTSVSEILGCCWMYPSGALCAFLTYSGLIY